MITTTNPATGSRTETNLRETTPDEVEFLVQQAAASCRSLDGLGRTGRATMLEAIATALESDRDDLVPLAIAETGLSESRLTGELSRSVFQFRLFAQALREGGYLEAAIDHAEQTPLGPGPDLRRMLVPIGPVAVFGSSNFPFAFSVAGGDTASALAAGCPVLIKAHDSHPLTSQRSLEAIQHALVSTGAPAEAAALVFGLDAARKLISHPLVRAVSFTGSLATGQTLMEIINQRAEPIPFYGELSSINPLVVTRAAAAARADEIAQGLFASVTGSGGQLCTKPGIAFVPAGDNGDHLVSAVASLTRTDAEHVLLNERIASSYNQIAEQLLTGGASIVARGQAAIGDGFAVTPMVLTTAATTLGPELAEECFGPLVVIARYSSVDEVIAACDRMPASLTVTVHAESADTPQADDSEELAQLFVALQSRAGRLVYNGYPTGVRVSWAQHHGGPWPSTNSQHTSVGVTAIRRFLRPLAWQSAPESVLPPELCDGYDQIPRRVDGQLVLPTTSTNRGTR